MRTLIAFAVLCAPATAAPVPKELRKAPRDPIPQTEVLIEESEKDRQFGEIIRRIWFGDTPPHLTPERIHGGIL